MPARALPAAGIRPGDSHYRSDLAGARAGKDLEARWDDAKAGLKPRTATDCHSVAVDIGQMQAGHLLPAMDTMEKSRGCRKPEKPSRRNRITSFSSDLQLARGEVVSCH
jgi:hypothetical protein